MRRREIPMGKVEGIRRIPPRRFWGNAGRDYVASILPDANVPQNSGLRILQAHFVLREDVYKRQVLGCVPDWEREQSAPDGP